MSLLDKVIAAVTPPETAAARLKAREKAMGLAKPDDWLSMILEHHQRIEALFSAVRAATTPEARQAALRRLAIMLTGHAIAEEAAIYPALAAGKQLAHAALAYQEQSAAKMELGLLERLDPMSEDFIDKLGHIEGAVEHHIYSEEGTWFMELAQDLSPDDQALVTRRYREEFERYMSGEDL